MNFDMAGELLMADGIETATVLGTDDIASAGKDEAHKRRGVAGIIYACKAAGARAEAGGARQEVQAVAAKAVSRTRTIGLALGACQVSGAAQAVLRSGR